MAPSPPAPLNIALVGVGNIGSAFGYYIAQAGHNITAIARPGSKRLAQLERDGSIVLASGESAKVTVASSLPVHVEFDLVIVTIVAHGLDSVLPTLAACKAKEIVFMINNWDPDRLFSIVGAERTTCGMPLLQASLDDDGKLTASTSMGATLSSSKLLVELLKEGKVPAAYDAEMALWVRCHTPLCIAFEAIAVRAKRRGGGASWAEAMVCARGAQAIWALLQQMGYQIYPSFKGWMNSMPAPVLASVFWSMSRITSFRELLALGEPECVALVKAVVETAKKEQSFDQSKIESIEAMSPAV